MACKNKIIIFIIAIMGFYLFVQDNIDATELDVIVNKNLLEAPVAYNNGEFSRAIREYKRLLDNGDIEAYFNLAIIFKDLGHYNRAIYLLRKAYNKFGLDLRTLSILGRLYYLNNETGKAIVIWNKIAELKADENNAYIYLGLCYEARGDNNKAQKYYEKAIALDENNLIAHLSLAGIYHRNNRLQEAANEYKKVNIIDKSIISIQKMLADILFKIGNSEESFKIYQRLRLIDPGDELVEQRLIEIGNKLGKDYFEKEKERIVLQRKRRIVLVKPFPRIKRILYVKVGLTGSENLIEFKCSTPFEIKTKDTQIKVTSGIGSENYQISNSASGEIIITTQNKENIIVNEPIVIKPLKSEGTITIFNVKAGENNFWAGKRDRSYRGIIEVSPAKNGIKIINIINLEEYLYSVVPSEMPAKWPKEALKAQAVAARSEAMAKLGRHKDEGFDFCAEVHCQVYNGVEEETEATYKAVDETRGLAMTYNGKPIDAIYSSNCGGHTQDNIFGDIQPIPYLKGKLDICEKRQERNLSLSPLELEDWLSQPQRDILCNTSKNSKSNSFRWIRIYNAEETNRMINKIANIGKVIKILAIKRQKLGHISAIKIVGATTSYIIEKELNIRKAFGNLRSSMFKVEIKYGTNKEPEKFIFYGGGWGHGVGMCQSGAYGMASQGKNYTEILKHYFEGIDFKKVY